jgi:hypothetical protein
LVPGLVDSCCCCHDVCTWCPLRLIFLHAWERAGPLALGAGADLRWITYVLARTKLKPPPLPHNAKPLVDVDVLLLRGWRWQHCWWL